MRKTFGAVVLTVLLLAWASPVAAITYGSPTGDAHGNVGSMVAEIQGEYFQVCSGTLIKHGVFLTAAHCVVGIPQDWKLYISFQPDLESPMPLIEVKDVVAHPDYGKNMANHHQPDHNKDVYQPGVFRVDNDGVRDLAKASTLDIIAGHDEVIWLLRPRRFFRLDDDEWLAWAIGNLTPTRSKDRCDRGSLTRADMGTNMGTAP